MAARPLWMAIVRPYTKTAGILSLAEYPLFLFYLQAGEIPPGQVKAVGGGHVAYPLPAQTLLDFPHPGAVRRGRAR